MNESEIRRAVHGSVAYQVARAVAFVVLVGLVMVVISLW